MNKRGQAAMEFLMTYGWAILAAIIAIGVLAYFGIFNPGRFVQDNVVVNAPFNARGAVADSTANTVILELLNGAGETVTVTGVNIPTCGGLTSLTQTIAAGGTLAFSVPASGGCSPALVSGDTLRSDITVTYTKQGTSLALTSTGSMTTRVQ